jgi:hypothetical protein
MALGVNICKRGVLLSYFLISYQLPVMQIPWHSCEDTPKEYRRQALSPSRFHYYAILLDPPHTSSSLMLHQHLIPCHRWWEDHSKTPVVTEELQKKQEPLEGTSRTHGLIAQMNYAYWESRGFLEGFLPLLG